jgi:hypothetical protein
MPSIEYTRLLERCEELRKKFIDFKIPNDREATNGELDSIAAFRLLVHGELEHFIEEKARQALSSGMYKWQTEGIITRGVLNLILGFHQGDQKNAKFLKLSDKDIIKESINKCATIAEKLISDNNGITKPSFDSLSTISGFLLDEIDSVLSNELDSFGKARGDVAHTSIERVRTLNSPEIEFENAMRVVNCLQAFDERILTIATAAGLSPVP